MTAPISIRPQFPEKLEPLFLPMRYKIMHGGRGGAKSWGVARALLLKGMNKKLRILCTREIQKSIKASVHKLLCDQIQLLGVGAHYTWTDNTIIGKNGTEFTFEGLGSQTTESIKSYEGYDIVWVEEAQTVKKRSWDILIPTIRKDDSEIWVTMNPELDTDDTYVRFITNPPPNAIVIQINYYDNPWFPKVLEEERIHCYNTDRENYDNIWEGKCRKSVLGAIYANEIESAILEQRIRNVPYDPMFLVHTVWDLGFNDSMTISMVQKVASELRIIDYIEERFKKIDWYVTELKKKDYNWGLDWLPHDGFSQTYKSKSAYKILKAMGRNVAPGSTKMPAVPNIKVESGIKEARMVFPRCYFDQTKTARLVTCLKRYRRRIDVQADEPSKPLHDEYSHGADNFRYLSLVADQMISAPTQKRRRVPKPGNWRTM